MDDIPLAWVRALDFALNEGAPSEDDLDALYELLAWLKQKRDNPTNASLQARRMK